MRSSSADASKASQRDSLSHNGSRNVPFGLFWTLAMLSNMASGAQSAGVMWLLGDPALQPWVLIVYQLCGVAGTLAGIAIGAQLIPALGRRKTLLLSSILEAAFSLLVGVFSFSPPGALSDSQAYLIAICCMGLPFAAGIGGPAWVMLVSHWPGTNNRTQQLLRDNVQFQLGLFTGPLVGGAVMASTHFGIQWLSIANAFTYFMIFVLLNIMKSREPISRETKTPWAPATVRLIKSPPMIGIIGIALGADSARLFLARLVREAEGNEFVYTTCLAILALSSAIAAGIASRHQVSDRIVSSVGLFGIALGLVLWSTASSGGLAAWFSGSILIGAAVALSYSALTSLVMHSTGANQRAAGVALGMSARTIFASIGGTLLGVLIPIMGATSLGVTAAMSLVAASYVALGRARNVSPDLLESSRECQEPRT